MRIPLLIVLTDDSFSSTVISLENRNSVVFTKNVLTHLTTNDSSVIS